MASLSGQSSGNDINITGETNGYFNEVYADNVITNQLQGQDIELFTGVTSNLQDQITGINTQIIDGYTGGGYFALIASSTSGYVSSTYFIFGAGANNATYAPIQINADFTITSFQIRVNVNNSSAAVVLIQKNGSTAQTISLPAGTTNYTATCDLVYTAQDFISVLTQSGSGGGLVKITLTCRTNGVVGPAGASPVFSIGTVDALPSSSPPTVSITGTSLLPILNFGLQQGNQGPQGIQGIQGIQGETGEVGGTPNFQIGTVTSVPPETLPTVTITGTQLLPVLNFGLQQGAQGLQGAQGIQGIQGVQGPKGDTGPEGPAGPAGSGVSEFEMDLAIAASATATLAAAALYTDSVALSTTTACNLYTDGAVAGLETQLAEDITPLQNKTQNITEFTTPNNTVFSGTVSCNDVDVDSIQVTSSITGLASISLNGYSGINTIRGATCSIEGQTLNLISNTGFGTVNIGGSSDFVFIQGFPFYAFSFAQWIP